jgi:hypothetical protein
MSNPATEMEISGTVIALMAGLNEIKMLNAVSKIVFNPSRNTGTLDDSAHPIKNYGIPTPFTIYENGVITQMPNVDTSIKPVPSPLTDWGKMTITYTDVKIKEAVEQLFTKYPNSIQLPFEPTTTAVAAVAAPAAPAAVAAPAAPAAPAAAPVVAAVVPAARAVSPPAPPRTKPVKKESVASPVAQTPTPATKPLKQTVRTTKEGVSAPYKSKSGMWCEVIIGNEEVGKSGDHLEVCSSQEGLSKLVQKYKRTTINTDEYVNYGGLPLKKQDGMEELEGS